MSAQMSLEKQKESRNKDKGHLIGIEAREYNMSSNDITATKANTDNVSFFHHNCLFFFDANWIIRLFQVIFKEEVKSRTVNVTPLGNPNNNILMEDARQPNASMANKVKAAENPPVRMVKPKKTFNPSAYKFHKKDYNFRQEAFIE